MSSLYDSQKGKRIYLYRNGDSTFFGKPLVVNRRQIRTVDVLLSVVTNHLSMPEQVREIRTPDQGRFVVRSLEELVDDQAYVAVGNGRFKRMQYTSLHEDHERKIELLKRRRERVQRIPPRKAEFGSSYVLSSINRPKQDEVIVILVYINGDEFTPARKIILRPRNLRSWVNVLTEVDDVLKPHFGPVTRLYTLDGMPLADPRDLVSGRYYVAAGRSSTYKKVQYGNEKKFIVQYHVPRQPYDSLFLTDSSIVHVGVTPRGDLSPSSRQQYLNTDTDLNGDTTEPRAQLLMYADGAEVFPRRPQRVRRRKRKKRGSVFKARRTRSEVVGAEEVSEEQSYHPQEEKFSDIIEAEEVQEEEIEGGDTRETFEYNVTPPLGPRPPNSTGNKRLQRGRRVTTLPAAGPEKVESGVGPSGSSEFARQRGSEELNKNSEWDRESDQNLQRDRERVERYEDNSATEIDIEGADSEYIERRSEPNDRKGSYAEDQYKDRRQDEAARRIQKAYRGRKSNNRKQPYQDPDMQQQQEQEQQQQHQPHEQQDEQPGLDYDLRPADENDPNYADENIPKTPPKLPNGQLKRSSIVTKRRVQ